MGKGFPARWFLGATVALIAITLVVSQFAVPSATAQTPPDTPGQTDETPDADETPTTGTTPDATGTTTPTATPDAAQLPVTGTEQEGGSGSGWLWVVAGLAVLGAGVLGLAALRSRSTAGPE